jgi:uncharacterized BrkB/YihY/UPF0761 family membrane protein
MLQIVSWLTVPAVRLILWIALGSHFVAFLIGRWSAGRGSQVVIASGSHVVSSGVSSDLKVARFLRAALFLALVVAVWACYSWVPSGGPSRVPVVRPCPREAP